jgi:hypothetical protein
LTGCGCCCPSERNDTRSSCDHTRRRFTCSSSHGHTDTHTHSVFIRVAPPLSPTSAVNWDWQSIPFLSNGRVLVSPLIETRAGAWVEQVILDLNGLLLHRRFHSKSAGPSKAGESSPPARPFDARAGAFHVWLRPHAATFLEFLVQRFHVAIWSSAQLENIEPLIKLLRPEDGDETFAFVWSQAQCTNTGESHPENVHRPLFLKETAKIFDDTAHAGMFSPENTLLIDDDAYKAERNLPNTCISPHPYGGETEQEECQPGGVHLGGIGPKGELRRWLGRLAVAQSVTSYVAGAPWPPTRAPPRRVRKPSDSQPTSQDASQPMAAASDDGGGGAGGRVAAATKGSRGGKGNQNSRTGSRGDRSDRASGDGRNTPRMHGKSPRSTTGGTQQQRRRQQEVVHAPQPAPEPASSIVPGASTMHVTAEERLEVTNALRVAVLRQDVEGLQLAVSVAQQLGLHSEASMGQQKLAQMLNSD